MIQTCATKNICVEPTEQNPSGFVVINESDFDPETMQEYGVAQMQLEAPKELKGSEDPELPTALTPATPWDKK